MRLFAVPMDPRFKLDYFETKRLSATQPTRSQTAIYHIFPTPRFTALTITLLWSNRAFKGCDNPHDHGTLKCATRRTLEGSKYLSSVRRRPIRARIHVVRVTSIVAGGWTRSKPGLYLAPHCTLKHLFFTRSWSVTLRLIDAQTRTATYDTRKSNEVVPVLPAVPCDLTQYNPPSMLSPRCF